MVDVVGVQRDTTLHAKGQVFESWATVSREGLGEALRDVTQHPRALHIGEWPCACMQCMPLILDPTPQGL
jgi:hypothetical protein